MSDTMHIVCPSCHARNRLPEARLGEGPNCGRCHKPLFDGHPAEPAGEDFDRHIRGSDIPVLVDFWAPWCGPCKMMAPQFEEAARGLEPRVRLLKLNTEQEPEIGGRFGIRSIPTLILFKGGREAARQAGAMNAAGIARWVRDNLA